MINKPINIIFDGPPSHISGRFVEVETDDGKSINAGEWFERKDGLWSLRITSLPTEPAVEADADQPCFHCGSTENSYIGHKCSYCGFPRTA